MPAESWRSLMPAECRRSRSMKKWHVLLGLLIATSIVAGLIVSDHKTHNPKVLLIGIDGASWNLMDPLLKAGKLPNFQKLIHGGVSASLSTITPTWSPLLWTSIATGKMPEKHGIRAHFTESGKFEVEMGNRRIAKAFWNILSDSGIRVGVVNWWLTWPAEEVKGFIVSDKYRRTRDQPYLTYPVELLGSLPKVGMNPEAFEFDKKQYSLPATLEANVLIQGQKRMNYKTYWGQDKAVFKTCKLLLEKKDVDAFAAIFRIVDISSHLFCRLPRTEQLNDESYSRLLAPIYIYADKILGELLKHAGPRTTVVICSDHGFRLENGMYDHGMRQNPPPGILILRGPNVRENIRLNQASIIDITPTLLYLLDLEVGRDMDGQVLREAFTQQVLADHKIQYIATYDNKKTRATTPSLEMDEETKDDFRALGYVQ
jgi:predicted AlkP superfamily phosphohydrolase/phosphomutase